MCGNEEEEIDLESFSPVVDYTVIELLLCLVVQKKYETRHVDFPNKFWEEKRDRPFYVELPKQMFDTEKSCSTVMKLQRSLYGLKDSSETWFDIIPSKFANAGLGEMESSPLIS